METFVVRVWVPSAGTGQTGLRGVVQRVGAGEQATFRDASELLAIIAEGLALRAVEPAGTGRET